MTRTSGFAASYSLATRGDHGILLQRQHVRPGMSVACHDREQNCEQHSCHHGVLDTANAHHANSVLRHPSEGPQLPQPCLTCPATLHLPRPPLPAGPGKSSCSQQMGLAAPPGQPRLASALALESFWWSALVRRCPFRHAGLLRLKSLHHSHQLSRCMHETLCAWSVCAPPLDLAIFRACRNPWVPGHSN